MLNGVPHKSGKSTKQTAAGRLDAAAIRWGLASIVGLLLVALYFWQVFVTMPHLVFFYGDTGSYLNRQPQRGVAVYYFVKSALSLWNDFYAVAVAQGLLLALVAALLAYAVGRLTRSAVLILAPLLVCLFKISLIQPTQGLSTDSLFPTACIGLMACALLLYEKVSPWRIACFLLFGFLASFIRSIGEVILWSLVLVLALRLWPERRRVLAVVAAGCLSIHALITAISHINYGTWVPQAQAGLVLIIGAAFIADEDVPPGAGNEYPSDFVAATSPMRAEYKQAPSWVEKYEIMDRYISTPIWNVAISTLLRNGNYPLDHERYNKFKQHGPDFADIIMLNEVCQQASLAIMRRSPTQYLGMVWMRLMAGINMFTSHADYPLQEAYNQPRAEKMITLAKAYMGVIRDPQFLALIPKVIADWQNASFALRADLARPLRAFFGSGDILSNRLTRSPLRRNDSEGGALNWLFVLGSVTVLLLSASRLISGRAIGDRLGVLLLLIVPTWGYLFVLSLLISPMGTYMDATSPFVYLALLIGAWGVIVTAGQRLWRAAAGLNANRAIHRTA